MSRGTFTKNTGADTISADGVISGADASGVSVDLRRDFLTQPLSIPNRNCTQLFSSRRAVIILPLVRYPRILASDAAARRTLIFFSITWNIVPTLEGVGD